ncbi:MAG TPA: DUF2189 domain-containing protein [Stellaceae bacterium]
MHIRNPVEWWVDQWRIAGVALETIGEAGRRAREVADPRLPAIRRVGLADLREALARGLDDFAASRSDVVFLCLIYPIAGLVLARLAFGYDMLPLLFPLVSGFALVGPVAGIGLYEISRRREQNLSASWADAFGLVRSPTFGSIVLLAVVLLAIYLLWLAVANVIYDLTLGPEPPVSIAAFAHDVFATSRGWAMIVIGIGVGFLFALLVLATSVVSFPLLIDRDVDVDTAVRTSVRAFLVNPVTIAAWGLIVAAGLVIGSLPAFLGLIVIMPVLGHATWHLYRRVVD